MMKSMAKYFGDILGGKLTVKMESLCCSQQNTGSALKVR